MTIKKQNKDAYINIRCTVKTREYLEKLKEEESLSISCQVLHMLKKHDPQIAELEKQTGSADNRYQDTLE